MLLVNLDSTTIVAYPSSATAENFRLVSIFFYVFLVVCVSGGGGGDVWKHRMNLLCPTGI